MGNFCAVHHFSGVQTTVGRIQVSFSFVAQHKRDTYRLYEICIIYELNSFYLIKHAFFK